MEETLERATEEGLLFQDEVPSTGCLCEMQVCLICAGSFAAAGAEKGWIALP